MIYFNKKPSAVADGFFNEELGMRSFGALRAGFNLSC